MFLLNNPCQSVTNNDEKVKMTIEQFQKFFEIYQIVLPYLSIEETKKALIKKKQDWIGKLQQTEFPVAFLGSYSAGKSTMINGILGREVLPEANESTTAFPTIVKKGTKDQAFIHFMDEDARLMLWDSFVSDIEQKIGQPLQREVNELPGKHLKRIKETFQQYEQETGVSFDQQALMKLQILLSNWGNAEYKGVKEISLSDLKNYVEGYAGAIYVDKIEVFLENLNIDDDIVLVDLPGLGVDNKRHVEFTKDYIKEKAKAFVVCISPFKVLQGQEIEFLAEMNKQNPTIIQRAFWVINQWDLPNNTQKQEALNSFNKRVREYNFTIKPERLFQTSALNYVLLKSIADDTIKDSQKLKNHLDNLKRGGIVDNVSNLTHDKAKSLLVHPEVLPFSQFTEALFNYLNKEAKDEFIADAKKELLQVIRILDALLKPLDDQYSQSTNLEGEMKAIAINQKFRQFLDQLKQQVENFSKEIRTNDQRQFWQESDTFEILREIDQRILRIDRKNLANDLRKGTDIDFNIARLPNILDKEIGLTLLMRDRLVSVIDSFFIQRLNKLLTELETINPLYLPEKLRDELADKLDERDISMRLSGLADALFYLYGKELQRLGLSLEEEEGKTFSEQLEKVLKMYKNELDKLTRKLVTELNINLRLSLKNHTEYLEETLLQLFDEQQDDMIGQISRNINLDTAIADEINKQGLITSNYAKLITLKNEVMSGLGTQNNGFQEDSKFDVN